MEKVLLLNPPGDKLYQRDMYCSAVSKAHYYWPPIDLLIQSGILGKVYEVDVIDAIAEGLSPSACRRRISSGEYKAVVFLTGTASWKQDFEFLSRIRSGSNRPLLVGNGDVLLHRAEDFLRKYDFLDAVLFDYTSPDILRYLGGDFRNIASMAFRVDGRVEVRRERSPEKECSYPTPRHEKFPLKKYFLAHGKRFPSTTVQLGFGCPFRCTFCIASTLGFKSRPVAEVMEELRYVRSLGIKEVFFTDFTFEAKRKSALELCRLMAEEKLGLSWVCSSRAGTLDRELLVRMKSSGCHTVLIGVESGEEKILVEYSKGVTKDQVRQAFALCREMGIRTLGHFIIGLPGETESSVRRTIEFAKELDCDFASFNIAVPALGTKLRSKAISSGWLRDDTLVFDASDSYPIMETPQFSRNQAWEWRRRAVREFYLRPSYLWRRATAANSFYQWKVLASNGWAVVKSVLEKGRA